MLLLLSSRSRVTVYNCRIFLSFVVFFKMQSLKFAVLGFPFFQFIANAPFFLCVKLN